MVRIAHTFKAKKIAQDFPRRSGILLLFNYSILFSFKDGWEAG